MNNGDWLAVGFETWYQSRRLDGSTDFNNTDYRQARGPAWEIWEMWEMWEIWQIWERGREIDQGC